MGNDVPAVVEKLLEWWLERVQEALQEQVQNVTRFGGVAPGEFAPAWSDVDVCVMVDGDVTTKDAQRLTAVHDEMCDRYVGKRDSAWPSTSVVERFYVAAGVAAEQDASERCFVGFGRTRKVVDRDPLSPFDRLQLSQAGMVYFGEPVTFRPPLRESLRGQLKGALKYLREPVKKQADSSLWNMELIDWIARSIIFWRDDRLIGENAALRELIDEHHPFCDASQLALAVREGAAEMMAERASALKRAFLAIAYPAAETINRLAHI